MQSVVQKTLSHQILCMQSKIKINFTIPKINKMFNLK